MPRAPIPKATWDQIKIARAAGASYGAIAKKTGIQKGTIMAHAHRNGWTKTPALSRPGAEGAPSEQNVTDALTELFHERGRQTRIYLSEFLVKAAKRLAEHGEEVSIDSLEAVKAFEQIRASLYPTPVMVDHRSVNVSLSAGLSEDTLKRITEMTKLM